MRTYATIAYNARQWLLARQRLLAPQRLLDGRRARLFTGALALIATAGCATGGTGPVAAPGDGAEATTLELPALARQVEIRRTTHGVPHILAENLRAAGFALAYVQLEDHGAGIIRGMQAARGRLSLVDGAGRVDMDAVARQRHARAVEAFHLLKQDTRDVYEGFAEGMNHFIRVHGDELPEWMRPDFTGQDVLARDVNWPSPGAINRFRARLIDEPGNPRLRAAADIGIEALGQESENVGSNAWALGPERTTSGRSILLRNPHLSWSAGYYEAHVRVPGKLDFYGDFRIGGPFTVIGGFNPYLGFSTTNNATRSHEFYAFRLDPRSDDHFLLDDVAHPLRREVVTVEYRDSAGTGTETREYWTTHLGPVVHRNDSTLYVYRPAASGDFRAGEQWLEMMKATSLGEWNEAMRIQSRMTSNFTYADRDGNIGYVWVSGAPLLPHPPGGDSVAVLATRSDQVWSVQVPFDSLPRLLNPRGGYIHNENDSPHYTNLNHLMEHGFSYWVQPPRLRMRSQHALQLLHNDRVFSLEDVVEAKHSMRMLLADRVKDDLIAAVRDALHAGAIDSADELAAAVELLAGWDNTAARESRGGVLFAEWWDRYRARMRGNELYAVPWSEDDPISTPRGLADPAAAADAFADAVPATARQFGSWDVAWGEVHRVRRGNVDAPVGGCGGALGCFRVLNFGTADDGRRVVNGGDGWVLAVEFGDEPRAYSILAYGQSPDPDSPYHADQAAMFAANRMKPVAWSEADIEAAMVERYRPGEARGLQ